MLKKALIVLGVLLVGGWLWAKTDVWSYAKTAWHEGRAYVKKQVPLDFEIKRAREMIASLNQEEDKLISVMAKQMVAIEGLEKEIERDRGHLARQKDEIQAKNDELKSGQAVLVSDGIELGRDVFVFSLEKQFNNFVANESAAEAKTKTLDYHKQSLAGAKEQLDAVRSQKHELQARLDLAEVELQNVKAAQARSRCVVKFDDSQLAKVKELVDEIETNIREQKYELKLRDNQRTVTTTPTRSTRSPSNLAKDIDSHFGAKVAEKK
jgi:predicted  nucleic acid-binding Zn-ribbon protein